MNVNALRVCAGISAFLMSSVHGGWFPQPAVAQTYPSGPIHIILPYAAGGLVDALARVTGARLAESMGQPVIVENRPGASSTIGMAACANAKPDGHTVCPSTADALSYNPQLFANLPYDPEKSFAPVIMMALTNNLLVANANRWNRSTMADVGTGPRTWVYGRAGRPCRRCGTRLLAGDLGRARPASPSRAPSAPAGVPCPHPAVLFPCAASGAR